MPRRRHSRGVIAKKEGRAIAALLLLSRPAAVCGGAFLHPGRCGAQAATRPTRQKQMRPRQNPKQSRRGGMTASPTALRLPRRGRRPRRPAVTASADPTAFHRPPPGRGMVSRYIMRHMARFPPAVGVGVLDDPFLRPPPAPRRRAGAAGGGAARKGGTPGEGSPFNPLLRFVSTREFRALRRASMGSAPGPRPLFCKKAGQKTFILWARSATA